MAERIPNAPRLISITELQDNMGFWEGNELGSTIANLAPQVALWRLAKENEGEVLSTNSAEVIDFIRKSYFKVHANDLAYSVYFFLSDAKDEEFNFGLSYSMPDEWPEGASGTERFYFLIEYPKYAEKYRFGPNLKLEKLREIAETASVFGKENSLWTLYQDARRMWEEETGTKFPKDSKRLWLLFYTGVFLANAYPREIKPKFVNIEASVLGGLKPFFKSRVAANLDEAIKSFSSYSLGN